MTVNLYLSTISGFYKWLAAEGICDNIAQNGMDGTYVERTRPEVRTLYFQDGEFRTIVTLQGDNLPKQEERIKARQTFC